ncbi:MAG: hypothetical protein AAFQ65_10290 [Myxococcota bacterium]
MTQEVLTRVRRKLVPAGGVLRQRPRVERGWLVRLARVAIRGDLGETRNALESFDIEGSPSGVLLLDVLGEAARLLERWYQADRCSSTERAMGIGALHVLARNSGRRLLGSLTPSRGCAVLVSLPGTTPSLAPVLHHLYAEAAGWRVDALEGETADAVVTHLGTTSVDVVLISITLAQELNALERIVRAGAQGSMNPAVCFAALADRLQGSVARRADRLAGGLFLDPLETHAFLRSAPFLLSPTVNA